MKKLHFFLLLLLALAVHAQKQVTTFTDSRDGKKYKTVKIGKQVWMAENLNYAAAGSKCYGEGGEVYDPETEEFVKISSVEVQANCVKYGRLYTWATSMDLPSGCNFNSCVSNISVKHNGICPSGWHIPSNEDWDDLMTAVGGSSTAARHLKGISSDGSTDTYGFAALLGGSSYSDGNFHNVGHGYWWSATGGSIEAYFWSMYYDIPFVVKSFDPKLSLYSVRCIKE
jgi:uncharacterized protein (TIGR02145 family)